VLKKIFGSKTQAVTEGWRKFYRLNEELHDLYYSSDVLRVIKSKRQIWVGRTM
jgi:hypothetical protein